jgi:hypothetical protein
MYLALSLLNPFLFFVGGVLQMHMAKLVNQSKHEVMAEQTGVY